MKTFNKNLMAMAIGAGVCFSAVSADAFLCYDAWRTAEHAGQGVQRMLSLVSEYQKVYSKKEELKTWENRKKIPEDKQPTGTTYSEMKKDNPMEMGSEKYLPAQEKADTAEKDIKEKFFLPADKEDSKITTEERNRIERERYAYVEELAKEVLSLSANVRKSTQSELSRLNEAVTAAGGDIQQIEMLIQNKKTMIEQKQADIILQAKLMELEAAKMLLRMDPQLIANPESNTKK